MRRRKFLALAGAAVIAVGLTACGKKTADSQPGSSAANNDSRDEKEAADDEDVYEVNVEEEGVRLNITCKRGGNKIEQTISSYDHEKMNRVAADYAETFGKGAEEVAGKNWEKIEYEVTLSEKIIYGEGDQYDIRIYVPDTTAVEEVKIRLIAEDESTVELEALAGLGATTDSINTILGTKCISVKYQ